MKTNREADILSQWQLTTLKLSVYLNKVDLQQENNGFGPLSKRRGKASLLAALLVVTFSTVVHLRIAHSTGNQQGRDELVFLLYQGSFNSEFSRWRGGA